MSGWVVTLVRRSISPTDDRTWVTDATAPWGGVVMSTAVAGPATNMKQPRTSPRDRLGKCKADHSSVVGLRPSLPWPGLKAARPLLPLWRLTSRRQPWDPGRGRPYHNRYLCLQLAQTQRT